MSDRKGTILQIVVLAALGAAIFQMNSIQRSNTSMHKEVAEALARGGAAKVPMLPIGATVRPLQVKALDGTATKLDWNTKPTIAYVFQPNCHWCKRNTSNLNTLYRLLKDKYNVVALSLTDHELKEYVAEARMEMPIYTGFVGTPAGHVFTVGTPSMALVDTSGKITNVWSGAWTPVHNLDTIESKFGIKLPGMTPEPATATR